MDDLTRDLPGVQREPSRTRTYVAAVLVEALIVAGLYLFGRYFSA